MSKRLNTINLGEIFKEKRNLEQGEYYREFKTLRECYTSNWSDAKQDIYDDYKKMLNDNCDYVKSYGIRTFSAWIITLHAIVEKDNKKYYLVITPSHNWYVEIGE